MSSKEIKKVWIISHHTTSPKDGPSGRHYAISKYLARDGYDVYVFAGNVLHSTGKVLEVGKDGYKEYNDDGFHLFHSKVHEYHKNDIHRILNIISFYFSTLKTSKKIEKKYGKPDIVYSSTMTPLALAAGNKLAKKYKVKSINETRDIIPEGFVTKGTFKEHGIIANTLRRYMHRMYDRADALIFTMSKGKDYIEDMKWDVEHGGKIRNDRIYNINNGVDRERSIYNEEHYILPDEHLDDDSLFNVVYCGSIRFFNNMPIFIDAAKELKNRGYDNIKILLWGSGIKIEETKKAIADLGLDNIVVKGFVNKEYIPSIVKRSNLCLMTTNFSCVDKYGASPNKLFDYFQAGRPIIVPTLLADSMVESNGCGMELDNPDGKKLADAIIRFATMDKDEYQKYCENSAKMAEKFDYKVHAKSLEKIFDDLSE